MREKSIHIRRSDLITANACLTSLFATVIRATLEGFRWLSIVCSTLYRLCYHVMPTTRRHIAVNAGSHPRYGLSHL